MPYKAVTSMVKALISHLCDGHPDHSQSKMSYDKSKPVTDISFKSQYYYSTTVQSGDPHVKAHRSTIDRGCILYEKLDYT